MARNYKIWRYSQSPGWGWHCKDDPRIRGSAKNRRDARQQAKGACSEYVLLPPPLIATIEDGHINTAMMANLDGEQRKWDAHCNNWGLNEDDINWFFGYDCDDDAISQEKKVITALSVWGIYLGGETSLDIEEIHNLTSPQFDKIRDKDFLNAEVSIDDITLQYTWTNL